MSLINVSFMLVPVLNAPEILIGPLGVDPYLCNQIFASNASLHNVRCMGGAL